MITAYVLLNTDSVDPTQVAQELMYIEEVDNVHQTTGEYALIARINAENMIDLREDILKKMEAVKGVMKTTTLIVEDQIL